METIIGVFLLFVVPYIIAVVVKVMAENHFRDNV
jgi:hypothetical protein